MATAWQEARENLADIRSQWQAFRRGATTGLRIRRPIIRSWQRCLALGVPEHPGRPANAAPALAIHEELIHAAIPVLADLRALIRQTDQVMVLCGAGAEALLVEGDPSARRMAERINLVPGSDWSEVASGTNAMGTALAETRQVTVLAAEHYLEDLHPWACVAAPIHHPITGRVLGVLDLSGREMLINQYSEIAVRSAVAAIQARLATREAELHETLLAALADQVATRQHGPLGVIDRHGRVLRFTSANPPQGHQWTAPLQRLLNGEDEVIEESPTARLVYRPVRHEGRVIGALVETTRPSSLTRSLPQAESPLPGLVGCDPRWLTTLDRAAKGARSDLTILLTGETGTGKEVVARAIHQASARASGPFVALNCATLSPGLTASQLFGYVGGAFTGANPRGQAGLFESAQHGTLFLDEVSELPPDAQATLLRVLQEHEVVRVGGHTPIKVDVRVVAASNRDLKGMVEQGHFRADLYFRLSVFPLTLPPLRERPQDIALLVAHGYRRLGATPASLPPTSWQRLLQHTWPGNVRELLNLVEQAVTLDEDPANLLPLPSLPPTPTAAMPESGEAEQIRQALSEAGGNAAAAARILGMGRSTLYRKLECYGIRLKRQIE